MFAPRRGAAPRSFSRPFSLSALALLALARAGPAQAPLPAQVEVDCLTPISVGTWDGFGCSVDTDGTRVAVGCEDEVYVFRRDGDAWTEEARLVAPPAAAGRGFGWSVALDADVLVVGAPFQPVERLDALGIAWVYERDGSTWTLAHMLRGDLRHSRYLGWDVDVDGEWIAAHVPALEGGLLAATYTWRHDGETWRPMGRVQSLTTLWRTQPWAAYAGTIALDRDTLGRTTLVVGSPFYWPPDDRGALVVARWDGSEWQSSVLQGTTLADEFLGISVALDGDTILAGTGSSRVLRFERAGDGWVEDAPLRLPDLDTVGWTVALAGDLAVVGAPYLDEAAPDAGAVFAYRRNRTGFTLVSELLASAAGVDGRLGQRLATDGVRVFATAPGHVLSGGTGELLVHEPQPQPGVPLCLGSAACPCGNDPAPVSEGCRHSGGRGARLAAQGTTSLAADDLVLVATQLPPGNAGLFFCGDAWLGDGTAFFDGLRCAAGDVRRFASWFRAEGIATDTGFVAQDPSGTFFVPGGTDVFQGWFRDVEAGPSPCGTGANLTPGYGVVMQP